MPDMLIVVDMINAYGHPDADAAAAAVERTLPAMRRTIDHAREDEDQEIVYVNDHLGMWTSDRRGLVDQVLETGGRRDLVEPLLPADEDALILKARHSVFYETPLEYFLREREARTLTFIGQVTEQCILYSALDAYVRHFEVRVVEDAVAEIDEGLARAAVRMMRRNMRASIVTSDRLDRGSPGVARGKRVS